MGEAFISTGEYSSMSLSRLFFQGFYMGQNLSDKASLSRLSFQGSWMTQNLSEKASKGPEINRLGGPDDGVAYF